MWPGVVIIGIGIVLTGLSFTNHWLIASYLTAISLGLAYGYGGLGSKLEDFLFGSVGFSVVMIAVYSGFSFIALSNGLGSMEAPLIGITDLAVFIVTTFAYMKISIKLNERSPRRQPK